MVHILQVLVWVVLVSTLQVVFPFTEMLQLDNRLIIVYNVSIELIKSYMFKPKYTITNKLLGNIKRIAEIVTDLNSRSFPKVVLLEMERRAREISAHSSTSIEGNPLPLTEVKKNSQKQAGICSGFRKRSVELQQSPG